MKNQLGEATVICLALKDLNPSLREADPRHQVKTEEKSCLLAHSFFHTYPAFIQPRTTWARNWNTHCSLSPPTSISNQDISSQACPQIYEISLVPLILRQGLSTKMMLASLDWVQLTFMANHDWKHFPLMLYIMLVDYCTNLLTIT